MKWKCKQSGNTIDLPDSEEKSMLRHPGYEKVEEVKPKQEEKKPAAKKTKE